VNSLTHISNPQEDGFNVWYAVYTRYQHERIVATILGGKGFQVFLPTYRVVRRWSDRKKELTLPLFPGYVFFIDQAGQRTQVVSTPGVHSIVANGKVPAAIPNEEIVAIRRAVESPVRVLPHPFLRNGDLIRIRSGPLAGLEGLVCREKETCRVVLSVRILGRSAAVEVDVSMIERVQPAQTPAPPTDQRQQAWFPEPGRISVGRMRKKVALVQ